MLLKINLTAIYPNSLHDEEQSIAHNLFFSCRNSELSSPFSYFKVIQHIDSD